MKSFPYQDNMKFFLVPQNLLERIRHTGTDSIAFGSLVAIFVACQLSTLFPWVLGVSSVILLLIRSLRLRFPVREEIAERQWYRIVGLELHEYLLLVGICLILPGPEERWYLFLPVMLLSIINALSWRLRIDDQGSITVGFNDKYLIYACLLAYEGLHDTVCQYEAISGIALTNDWLYCSTTWYTAANSPLILAAILSLILIPSRIWILGRQLVKGR